MEPSEIKSNFNKAEDLNLCCKCSKIDTLVTSNDPYVSNDIQVEYGKATMLVNIRHHENNIYT